MRDGKNIKFPIVKVGSGTGNFKRYHIKDKGIEIIR